MQRAALTSRPELTDSLPGPVSSTTCPADSNPPVLEPEALQLTHDAFANPATPSVLESGVQTRIELRVVGRGRTDAAMTTLFADGRDRRQVAGTVLRSLVSECAPEGGPPRKHRPQLRGCDGEGAHAGQ